jgi:phosphohistidine phosphatase SixA
MNRYSFVPARSWIVILFVLVSSAAVPASGLEVVYVVRHAQKSADAFWSEHGPLRPLSEKGVLCAERLAAKLADEDVAAVYSSETTRTVSTGLAISGALPATATATDATVRDLASFARDARSRHAEDHAILVVGHSNTVGRVVVAFAPEVVACFGVLGLREDGSLSEKQYGDVWRIHLDRPACDGGVAHESLGTTEQIDCMTP